jgi:hypothetical protein
MRYLTGLAGLLVLGCRSGDSIAPEPTFADVAGVYSVNGNFDGFPIDLASFSGTLIVTQASQTAAALGGSAAFTGRVVTEVFNLSDDALDLPMLSPEGVITFSLGSTGTTWSFTGNDFGTSIASGRHTISRSNTSFSGSWTASRTETIGAERVTGSTGAFRALVERLSR